MENLILDKLSALCAKEGYFLTFSRKHIVLTLYEAGDFMSAETLWIQTRAKQKKVSLATVYNVLNWLIRNNLVQLRITRGRKIINEYRLKAIEKS